MKAKHIKKLTSEEKIKFSEAEKKEFDKIKVTTLYDAFRVINDLNFTNLLERLFANGGNNQAQLEFARAWENPSLLEVEKENKYVIKFLDSYVVNGGYIVNDVEFNRNMTTKYKENASTFTQSELDKMQTLEEFKGIDLNKCKEEIE